MTKAVFFDIDGTIFSHTTASIPESAIEAVRKLRENGILVFIATGRHPLALKELHIMDSITADAMITINGGYCYNDKEPIYENTLDKQDLLYIQSYVKQHHFPCMFIEKDRMYHNYVDGLVEKVCASIHTASAPVGDVERIKTEGIFQVVTYMEEDDMEFFSGIAHGKITRWNPGAVDIIPATGGKHIGIERILAYYGLKKEETMAFGDADNDLEMFELVQTAVAMGNGNENVKAAADYITNAIDEDGIYQGLKHYELI